MDNQKIIDASRVRYVVAGRQGESAARSINFDISGLTGNGDLYLYLRRPGEKEVYTAAGLSVSGTVATWIPDAFDTQFAGRGQAEIRLMDDGICLKSVVFMIEIIPSLAPENGVRSIISIERTDTEGLVDTYTITYTDGTTSEFTVTNGAPGEPGVTPEIELLPTDTGYTLRVTVGEMITEYAISPIFLDAGSITQQTGHSTTQVMSQSATTQAIEANKGWTTAQINLLAGVATLLRQLRWWVMMIGDPEHPDENPGYALAGDLCNKLDELIESLRGGQPTGITYEMQPDGALRITAAPAGSYTITTTGALKIM